MSVTTENAPVQGQTTLQENRAGEGVYASLFEKINLTPASRLGDINDFLDDAALSEAPAAERLTAAMQVFMERIRQSGQRVEKLDKTLIDHHIAELDFQISRQLDAVMHHQEFQQVESLWRGLKQLVDNTDYRQNVKTEILDVAKDDLRQDFEDAPELIQSGLYWHTYTAEYDTPGGEPAFVPDGGFALSGLREPPVSPYTPGPASAAPPGRTPPAPYLPLCRMAASPYPAYGILPQAYTAPPSNKRQAAYLTPSAWPRTPGCCSAPAKPPASGPGTAKQPASGSHPPALHAPQSRHR
ncbi:EvpB/family type VI secretion protein [Klebsiella pneumoniae]|nr:EvpB/family type VI secretion protein [Klebsiella pneumoniae]